MDLQPDISAGVKIEEHQFAFVVFSDLVGYGALITADKQKAFEVLIDARKLHEKMVPLYNGKLLAQIEDGFLIAFETICDAAIFSIELVKESQNLDFKFRIGIHCGEVISDEDEIGGEAVDIATKLQDLATRDQILVSNEILDSLKDEPEFTIEPFEEYHLADHKVYELAGGGLKAHPHRRKFYQHPGWIAGIV
jgi:class 3 adenylate cyclase